MEIRRQRNIVKKDPNERNIIPKTQMIKIKVTAVITSGKAMLPPNTHGMVDLKMLETTAFCFDSMSRTVWIVRSIAIAGVDRKSST